MSYMNLLMGGGTSAPVEKAGSVDLYGTTHTTPSIALPNGSVLSAGAMPNEFCIECWIKVLASRGAQGGIFCTGSSGLDITMMQNASNGVLGMFGANQSTFAPTLNLWTHIAYVRSVAGGFQRWLVNGVQHDNTANSTFARTIGSTLRKIGGDGAGDSFAGRLSDLRVWNIARANATILDNYNRRLTGAEPGLAGYWKMNEGAGTTVADSTSGAATGTFSSGTDILWSSDCPSFN
jgi:hypothetical protein